MPLHPSWIDLALRLFCTCIAGVVIGLDRGEHGRPAGLRTTMLVGLAACIAIMESNLLLSTAGKPPDSFVNFDVMRLPLGILTGVGFIGAGAIVRRDNMVLGVTTAATLWFITVIGLSFGGGQYALGSTGVILGAIVLTGLRRLERNMKHDRQATLKIVTLPSGPTEQHIREMLAADHYRLRSLGIVAGSGVSQKELTCEVEWRASGGDSTVPSIVAILTARTDVVKVCWEPSPR